MSSVIEVPFCGASVTRPPGAGRARSGRPGIWFGASGPRRPVGASRRPSGARCGRFNDEQLAGLGRVAHVLHATPFGRQHEQRLPVRPPSMHAKHTGSSSILCSTSPPSRTRTQRLFGTSAYQTAPSASMQIPSGGSSPGRPTPYDSTDPRPRRCRRRSAVWPRTRRRSASSCLRDGHAVAEVDVSATCRTVHPV